MSSQVRLLPPQTPPRVMSRQSATSKLRHLTSGSLEHFQLQAVLHKTSGIVEICLPDLSYKVNLSSPHSLLLGGFGSSEHVAIGEQVTLLGLPPNSPLLIKGVTPIFFHHIVALAGDFYGIYGQAISLPGGDEAEKTHRFINAFNTLVEANNDQIRRVLLEIDQECAAVKNSSLPHHCYSQQMIEKNGKIKKIKADIDQLLVDNSDHFSSNAQEAYLIGHREAIRVAAEAFKTKDQGGLKTAYAMEAFACHFLTDLFAAGHIRNQRGELETCLIMKLGFTAEQAKPLAGLLTGAQHEKDGNEGLNVEDGEKQFWRAYGDGNFFAPKNKENRDKVITATRRSVQEIHDAFETGNANLPSTMSQLIPKPTDFNPLPIYSVERGALFLHQGSEKNPVESQVQYLNDAISHAVKYLPQDYINGFIGAYLRPVNIDVPILTKVIAPQIERMTGTLWHVIGLATYYQATEGARQLNTKMDEMADVILRTHDNSEKILQQIQQANVGLQQLTWDNFFAEIKQPISAIKDMIHQQIFHNATLNEDNLGDAEQKLLKAYIRLSRIFCDGEGTDGRKVLAAYETMLLQSTPSMTPRDAKMQVTLWFRQMLDYQLQAFGLYLILKLKRHGINSKGIREQVLELDRAFVVQIRVNKDHLLEDLVDEPQEYITLQIEKAKARRAFHQLIGKK
jgi:hypothetical protein